MVSHIIIMCDRLSQEDLGPWELWLEQQAEIRAKNPSVALIWNLGLSMI